MFSLRLVTADYYLAAPLPGLDVTRSHFRDSPVRRVPVVRVFGATPAGQRACLHLHGIFPYLYTPYDGYGQQDPERYLRQIAFSIDRALNVALGNPAASSQHVFKITVVSGVPFYGYHEKEIQFMKIYLYNPAMVKRVSELLQGGAVMNKCYQPHEAHVPYLLQLFIDYNLYGMNLINLAAVKFRRAQRKGDSSSHGTGVCKDRDQERSFSSTFVQWQEDEIPSSLILEDVEPISTCELEVDGVAADIINRQEIEAQIGKNPGLQAIWEDEKQRRREKRESSQISPPDSQDRGYVAMSESEKILQKRLKEILKQNDFSLTLPNSLDCSNLSEEFSVELTLHSQLDSPDVLCSQANMVDVHRDEPQRNKGCVGEEQEDAVIDEEAILNVMETSQIFQSQRLSQSPVFLDDNQDQAMVKLLAGLEEDEYQMDMSRRLSQHSLSARYNSMQNSDDEENEPQVEKEEMELSILMSQRWDNNTEEHNTKINFKSIEESSSEDDSTDDEMEWSRNRLLLADLSIPQLDGTADENSDNPLNKESTLTHSSVIAKSKLSLKNSIFHKDAASFEPQSSAKTAFQCQHTSALSSHILKKEGLIEELPQPAEEKGPELSVHSFTNDSTCNMKYPSSFNNSTCPEVLHEEASKNDIAPVPAIDKTAFEDGIPLVNRHLQCRKFTSIRKTDKDISFLKITRQLSEGILDRNPRNLTELSNHKMKRSADVGDKCCSSTPNKIFSGTINESSDFTPPADVSRVMLHTADNAINDVSPNKRKARSEELQQHATDMTSGNQQATHYKFFPSVVLSNCLNRPQKLAPVTYKVQQCKKQSRLKLVKKKVVENEHTSATAKDIEDLLGYEGSVEYRENTNLQKQSIVTGIDTIPSPSYQDIVDPINTVGKDSSYAPGNACSKSPPDVDRVPSCDMAVMMDDGAFQSNACELNAFTCQFEVGATDSEPSLEICGNKYTLRAKRKVNFESEDGEPVKGATNSKSSLPQPEETMDDVESFQKVHKRRKVSNKLPPVIIKYIIINRFKGRKNMQVKLEKLDPSEEQVKLTEDKIKQYNRMAPLKDFWPKVPESPATKYPIFPVIPKKNNKRKTKQKSAKKKTGRLPKTETKMLQRAVSIRRKRIRSFLSLPMPTYNAETEDCDTDYKDVMSKLGFLVERCPSPINMSPPRCWSPTDPRAEEIVSIPVAEMPLFKSSLLVDGNKEYGNSVKKLQKRVQPNKPRKKTSTSPSAIRKQPKKASQSDIGKDGKKQKGKSMSKKSEKAPRKHIKIKDKKTNAEPRVSEQSSLLHKEQTPSALNGVVQSFPAITTEFSLSGFSTGHVHSTQPSKDSTQNDSPGNVSSFTGTPKPLHLQQFSSIQKDCSATASVPLSPGIKTFSINAMNTQFPNAFQIKECSSTPSKTQNSYTRSPQVIQNAQFTLTSSLMTREDPAEAQKRLLTSIGKLQDVQNSPSSLVSEKPKLLPCSFNHAGNVADTSKHCDSNTPVISSEKGHEALNSPNSSVLTTLKSTLKTTAVEQKQKGDSIDAAQFATQRASQNCLPEIFSCTKAIQNSIKSVSPQKLLDAHSGIAVLKELLHKKQQKVASSSEESTVKLKLSLSSPSEPKSVSGKSATHSKKTRAPRSTKSKVAKNVKTGMGKHMCDSESKICTSERSPGLFSEPSFESCYSIEDSLSPEHNYNFDINAVGQTGLCTLYSGSQFIPADQNLPQKFLSDPFPIPVSDNEGINHELQQSEKKKPYSLGHPLIRPSSLSPDMFEKSVDFKQNPLLNQWKNCLISQNSHNTHSVDGLYNCQSEDKYRLNRGISLKDVAFNCAHSEWTQTGTKCQIKNTMFDASHPPNSNSSFTGLLPSPEGDSVSDDLELYLSRHSGGLTPTPDSSPRSISSPSQSKNGNSTPRPVHILKPLMSPPSREEIMATLLDHDLMETIYQEPFFSNPSDAPEKPREVGGRILTIETKLPYNLLEFEGDFSVEGLRFWKTAFSAMTQNPRPVSPSRVSRLMAERRKDSLDSENDKKLVIMPCKSAPHPQKVQVWLQAKELYETSKIACKDKEIQEASESNAIKTTSVPVGCNSLPPKEIHILLAQPASSDDLPETANNIKIHLASPPPVLDSAEPQLIEREFDITASIPASGGRSDQDELLDNSVSPDSPILTPWQDTLSPDNTNPSVDDKDFKSRGISPSPLLESEAKTEVKNESTDFSVFSPSQVSQGKQKSTHTCIHSTPVVERKPEAESSEALLYSPLLSEPVSQRLSQRRGCNPDKLRRVLLTTQMKNQFATMAQVKRETSQIEGPSLNNSYGFKVSVQNLQDAKALHEVQHLTLMCMELHARTRRDLEPDPEFDPICALFYCISSDSLLSNTNKRQVTGAIVIHLEEANSDGGRRQTPFLARSGITGFEVTYATDEKQLFVMLLSLVRRFDPDILLGYEVQMHSWGYLLQRASALNVDLCQQLSRVPDDKNENRFSSEKDEYGADTMSEINIVGRIVLNVWRMMRSEAALTNYTFENVAFHILHQRFPLFTFRSLSDWFDNRKDVLRWKMADYYMSRVHGTLQLLEKLDLIGRTSELARLFGIQFLHVLTRGSQYRVESMMLRIAKPMNYIPLTPSIQQRSQMRAPQCIPLVMEPESRFYSNCILVLDFQSLYPSIVIAYNYCYSTCLGNVENLGKYEDFKFGCSSLQVPPDLLYQLRNDITVSPNGVAFVKACVRKGVLPRMLEEILKTRIMVKQSMKNYKQDKSLTRLLDARQLGLKLIANVTFGYTAANFSGRMPCVEIGDSIIHKARETLERAIKLVNDTKKWGAKVVYGDTDSMFVLLKGATKEQSFKIGQEIAEAVTATNPKPIKLKFEKVYLPCVLQTKKRYVGYMYETVDQKDPVFDAKGIETVRRDACPAVGKILERSLKLLFETRDISQIKQYVQRQCIKVVEGKASMQDLIFAKEYRGSFAYKPGACVPALELTRKMVAYDRRSEPRVSERVPYVIIYGSPGVPLIQLVRRPIDVLQDHNLRINGTYYITKQILPPLNRIFSLIGVDVFSWYDELPRIQKTFSTARNEQDARKCTISQYFTTLHCPVCDELTQHGICSKCRSQPQNVVVILNQEIRELEYKQDQLAKLCRNCTGCSNQQIQCVSLNCPVLFKLSRVSRELCKAPYLRQLLDQF
ncbi:REV3 like, DNA directed polymerase zeta catalytic subunit L homeolog [Xenopus laevis]|uniref:DNA polymerase zeta catalytic subunit n=1 Tax=Xenopus laevis TaxID=8355 RepID=D0VEW8_XENLA|nr:REV3 like, DNA directed polymerase zeta catalytic subunit L homeolog [Xenopus laevis]ACY27483.1 DNA polymerase zeta [Xenopus laevis]